MIFVITPLVKEAQRGRAWTRLLTYCSALLVSSILVGILLGWVGHYSFRRWNFATTFLACIAVLLSAREFGALRLPLPSSDWRVPRQWLRFGYFRGAFVYGLALGLGFLTRAPFATYHIMLIWILAVGDPAYGATLGLSYAAGRMSSVVGASLLRPLRATTNQTRAAQVAFDNNGIVHAINGFVLGAFGTSLLIVGLNFAV
jgi:hypothetical protein